MVGVGFGRLKMMLLVVTCILSQASLSTGRAPEEGRHLKQTLSGYVIDCVDIHKQPAFDHPLLRNHTLQVKPSSFPTSNDKENGYFDGNSQVWDLSKSCPVGKIPIQRIKKTENYSKRITRLDDVNVLADDQAIHEHAAVLVTEQKYYGTKASLSTWNPQVEDHDISISHIQVVSDKQTSFLAAGWMVDIDLYGDNRTRFFTAWGTSEENSAGTGCYNLDCPGFVQTSKFSFPGSVIDPVSIYGGVNYQYALEIFQDRETHNWLLLLAGGFVGYWPKELLPGLEDGAGNILWGGEVITRTRTNEQHTSTQMGSGHLPTEGGRRAAFFSNVMVLDALNTYRDPTDLKFAVESPTCYDVQMGRPGTYLGTYFYFGGPGRSQDCP